MPCSFSVSITETIFCSMFCAAKVLSCFDRAEDQACACIMTSRSILLSSEYDSSARVSVRIIMQSRASRMGYMRVFRLATPT